jgi:hypothetical protein
VAEVDARVVEAPGTQIVQPPEPCRDRCSQLDLLRPQARQARLALAQLDEPRGPIVIDPRGRTDRRDLGLELRQRG